MVTSAPEPDDDESYDDFMDRCLAETDGDEEACDIAWDNRGNAHMTTTLERRMDANGIVHKTNASDVGEDFEFILSDESVDRMGDVILLSGWKLSAFKKNPIALFGHQSAFPIGRWKNIRIEGDALRAKLEMAPEGTSQRIDEIRRLVAGGILKATSVGFKPIKHEPLDPEEPYGGWRFLEQELVETSIVSVPANANALAVAKGLDISDDTMALVFAGQGKGSVRQRAIGSNGGHAETSHHRRGTAMTLGQRITDIQAAIVATTDKLNAHLENLDDTNVSDKDMETSNTLNDMLARQRKQLGLLQDAERNLAGTNGGGNGGEHRQVAVRSEPHQNGNGVDERERERRRQYFQATSGSKEIKPLDFLVRAGVVTYLAKIFNRMPDDICKGYEPYSDERTRVIVDWNMRGVVNPAMTSVTGWAAELVQQINADYMGLMYPKSVLPRLSGYGLSLTFGRAGRIAIPTRSATPTIAGSFVGEGMPIPVRQGAFTAQILTPKKLAVITTWTREIDEHSIPAIEGLLRDAIQEDTAVAVDSVLLDANAATAIRPAGLFNGVTPIAATAITGGAFGAIVGDLKNLSGAMIAATKGNIRTPVWLMNPAEINSAKFIVAPNSGDFAFKAELQAGNLNGWPVIDSGTVPLKSVGVVDAADFCMVGADAPRFEISDQATLHEEDSAPLPIVPGSGTASAPVRSLFQTDTLALRMIQRMNWAMRRPGMVALVQGVTW